MQLEADHISFRYFNGPLLFSRISFHLKMGEIIGLKGRSGSGKSTFCRVLAGYEQPTQGKVLLNGRPLPKKGYNPVQYVFQHPEKAINSRWKMKKILSESGNLDPNIVETIGIHPSWLHRWPNELSGGELQRFCIARALSEKTEYLIADEMTTMLDSITQAQIWKSVLEVARKRNIGILVVSHDDYLLHKLCSNVVDFHKLISSDR